MSDPGYHTAVNKNGDLFDCAPEAPDWPYENVTSAWGSQRTGKMYTVRRGTVLYTNVYIPRGSWPSAESVKEGGEHMYRLSFDPWVEKAQLATDPMTYRPLYTLKIKRNSDGFFILSLEHSRGPVHTRIHEDGAFSDPAVYRLWPKEHDPLRAVLGLRIDDLMGYTVFMNIWCIEE